MSPAETFDKIVRDLADRYWAARGDAGYVVDALIDGDRLCILWEQPNCKHWNSDEITTNKGRLTVNFSELISQIAEGEAK